MNCPICLSGKCGVLFNDIGFDLVKCGSCGLVYLSSDVQELYEEDYFLNKRRRYYRNYRYDYDERAFPVPDYKNLLNKIKKEVSSGMLLDIGCGMGIFLDLARRAGFETTGADTSSYAVQYAVRHFNLNAVCGSLFKIDLDGESFDVVTMLDFLEHAEEPESMLREAWRLMKPGGLLVIVTPNERSLVNKISYAVYRLSGRRIKFLVKSNHAPEHRYYFSLESLNYLLRRTGFRITGFHYNEIDPALMDYGLLVTIFARIVFCLARLLRQQHKMTVFARKEG